jgi:hypothetical protein
MQMRRSGVGSGSVRMRMFVTAVSVAGVVAWLALAAQPVLARANWHVCLPQYTGAPLTWSAPNVTDGVVAGDLGWTGAFRELLFDNGTGGLAPDVAMQGLKDDNSAQKVLYLSFETKNGAVCTAGGSPQCPDPNNVIVLAFDPDNDPASNPQNDRRIFIYPLQAGATNGANSLPPHLVEYWNNSTTWNQPTSPIVDPPWLKNNIRVEYVGNGAWNVEMKIPINAVPANNANPSADSGINLIANGEFGFFVDVVRVDPDTGDATQRFWPPSFAPTAPENIANIDLYTSTPDPSTWGNASRSGGMCGGVYLSPGDITTQLGYTIDMTGNNTFNAVVRNSGPAATGIMATFSISTYGLSSDFKQIPAGNNPTAGQPVASGGATTFSVSPFNPSVINPPTWTQQDHDALKAHAGDSCTYVSLDGPSGTHFLNRSTWENMTVVHANSPFDHQFTVNIGAKTTLPPGAKVQEVVLRRYGYNNPPDTRWESALTASGLQPIGRSGNTYLLAIDPERGAAVDVAGRITPPEMRIPVTRLRVPPTAATNRPVTIRVRGGDLITLLASGSINLRKGMPGMVAGPNGALMTPEFVKKPLASPIRGTRVGQLVGSFDRFKTVIPIGVATTIKVPAKATSFQLATVDRPAMARQHGGAGYQVMVTQTPARDYVHTNSLAGRNIERERVHLPYGANLPFVIFTGERRTGRFLTIKGKKYSLTEPVGSGAFGFIVASIGAIP